MKKILSIALLSLPVVACTQHTIVKQEAPPEDPAAGPGDSTDPAAGDTTAPKPQGTPDNCLDGQDMDAPDVDVSACPAIPKLPEDAPMGKETINLGAWEMGTTADGENYKYGSLSSPSTNPRILSYDGGSVAVNAENLECWAKGYYRLRKILQDAPAEYVALRKAGFQYRFFQFQTDLRNGPTGYKAIASFEDHLVKWVSVITAKGVCQQPTLSKFRDYAKSELDRRGLPQPGAT